MKWNILLALGITFLFLGVTVNPAIAKVEQEKQSDDVEGLVAQIRNVVNEIQEKYGHMPTVRGLCNVIQSALDLTIGRIIYCIILTILTIPFGILFIFFSLVLGLYNIGMLMGAITLHLIDEYDRECTRYFNPSLKSLYTLSETRDITNLIDNCPCLQE